MRTRIVAVTAALLLFTIVAGRCHAQEVAVVNVPFAFAVGNTKLPPGEYQIQPAFWNSERTQSIRRTDGSVSKIVLTIAPEKGDHESEPKLIFNRYGHEYFLSQIWFGEGSGRKLLKSRREKGMARGEAPNQVALLLHAPSVQP